MKQCIACGMPMERPSDFAMADPSKDYCVHCARPDGSMQSYDEKAASMAAFLTKTQGFDPSAALASAKAMMARLPAWQGRA
ncbi:MAG TPA: zinc ribbon domain-containing protein [Rectinemataceae bacterium]|nr:zinc ribbon domain-containing protein [Rectinemataceae bacterium]